MLQFSVTEKKQVKIVFLRCQTPVYIDRVNATGIWGEGGRKHTEEIQKQPKKEIRKGSPSPVSL